MCGRVIVKSTTDQLLSAFPQVQKDEEFPWRGPRYNGSPGQEYPLIVKAPEGPGSKWIFARWGLIPSWIKEENPKLKPINARGEEIKSKPMFRSAYKSRRALMPITGFFEWQAITGQKTKKPYAIAMADDAPFCLAAIWEERQVPFELGRASHKTFAIVTCAANELVGQIHDRMPVIIAEKDQARWLSPQETDPAELIRPYPAHLMKMWPISTRVNSPRNDDPEILQPVDED